MMSRTGPGGLVAVLLATLLAAGYAAPGLRAVTVDVPCAQDNTLLDNAGSSDSNGGDSGVYVGRDNGFDSGGVGRIKRGLMKFDIAAHIPAGATVTGATLTLYMERTIVGNTTVTLHRVLASWGEGTASGLGRGAPAGAGDATWLHRFFDTVFWANPGGDFTPSASASQVVGFTGFYTWTSAQLAADVQDMLNQPISNHGWLLRGDESTFPTAKKFASREYFIPQNAPRLTVTYDPPPSVTITQWRSVRTHAGPVDHAIVLEPAASGGGMTGPTVEARSGGIRRIEVDFSGPVSVTSAAVVVTGQTTVGGVPQPPVSYTPASVAMVDADTAAILFDPGQLPDRTCYTIEILASQVPGLTGDRDVKVRALFGDATLNGVVALSDALLTRARIGTSVAANPNYDNNLDGSITLADALAAKGAVPGEALCP